jgi:hypothetical protein
MFQPAEQFMSRTAIEQLRRGRDVTRPLRLFLGLSRINQQSHKEQVYVYESPIQVRILTRTDALRGEPVLPQFQLPLTALFDEVQEAG